MLHMELNIKSYLFKLAPFGLAFSGFLFFYLACFPGLMSPDSVNQYSQAIHVISYSDRHPPVMAWLFSFSHALFNGPQGILIFHLSLFWGSALLFFIYFKKNKLAWLFLILGFLPWIANFEAVLWKDVGMADSLLAATALLLFAPQRKVCQFFALILLLYAFMVRHNAVFAVIPIIWFWIGTIKSDLRWFNHLILTIIMIFGFHLFSNFFNYSFLKVNPTQNLACTMSDDLINISFAQGKNLLPPEGEIIRYVCLKQIAEVFSCREKPEICARYNSFYKQEKEAWLKAVKNYPLSYLNGRLNGFATLLRIPDQLPYYFQQRGIIPNNLGLVLNKNIGTYFLENYIFKSVVIMPFFFKPYIWLIFAIDLLILAKFLVGDKRIILLIRTLIISAIFYILGYIPIAPAPDFRYVYWSIIALNFAALTLLVSDNVKFRIK